MMSFVSVASRYRAGNARCSSLLTCGVYPLAVPNCQEAIRRGTDGVEKCQAVYVRCLIAE